MELSSQKSVYFTDTSLLIWRKKLGMNWKLIISGVLLLIVGFTGYGQRCKYIVDEVDPLTDDIIRTIKNRITGPITGISPYYYFYYMRSGSNHKIKVEVADFGEQSHAIPKGSELIIRIADGTIIRMNSLEEAKPKLIKEFSTSMTAYEVEYEIPEEEMKKIVNHGITFIRGVDFKNSFSDQKIPKPVTEQSRLNAECMFR